MFCCPHINWSTIGSYVQKRGQEHKGDVVGEVEGGRSKELGEEGGSFFLDGDPQHRHHYISLKVFHSLTSWPLLTHHLGNPPVPPTPYLPCICLLRSAG